MGVKKMGVRFQFFLPPLWLSPPRWRIRRPPPVASLRCCRATHPPSVLRLRDEMAAGACQPNWIISNAFAHQQLAIPHHVETGTSGCAGRRRWSAATGGGSHTPRWRFVRGSSCSSFDVQHKTHPANRASRRAAHTVAPKITNAPNTVVTIGTSENKNQPHSDAHNKSKNRSDCNADTSTAWKARVMK